MAVRIRPVRKDRPYVPVRISRHWCVVTSLAPEREEHETKHVGGGQQRRQRADHPQDLMTLDERLEEDFVLAEKAGERWDPGNRDRADDERPERNRQLLLEPT